MSILCRLDMHRAVPSNIWNDGFYFSRCSDCGCDMIGRGGKWQRVPRGYRVVWRPRTGDEISWKPFVPIQPDAARLTYLLATDQAHA